MRRAVLLVLALLALGAPAAEAHPLGNFTVNHLSRVSVSADRVDVRYILDLAEIPTFQARDEPRADRLASVRAEVGRRLVVRVDGRPVRLAPVGEGRLTSAEGQGGLPTTRVELLLRAAVQDPSRVELVDGTYPGRVGWRSVVARPGEGTAVRSDVPSGDPTDGLRRYPAGLLDSPLDVRRATLEVEPGKGTLTAPPAVGRSAETTSRSGDGFAEVFAEAAAGRGVLLFLLLSAFAWGALHALSPGHGKGMVAAFLVGTRGTARHAVVLGATVTVTHTIGVFAFGLVTLLLSQYILPEDLYPWLGLLSGVLVVIIGIAVLRSRTGFLRRFVAHDHDGGHHDHGGGHAHGHHHHGDPDHGHAHGDHGHDHDHGGHDHDHGGHDHDHDHGHGHGHSHHGHHDHGHHHGPRDLSWRGLVGMGTAAGILPCPSALVVLLAAIAQGQIALGMLLIVAFSVGLAGTLTALGLLVVRARGLSARLRVPGPVVQALPALSALVIIAAGVLLTVRALPGVV